MNDYLERLWQRYRQAPGVVGELVAFLLCLLLGLVAVPCLIWMVGRVALGAYTHGGLFSLWRDFLQGLSSGSLAYWVIALGPYGLLCLLRGWRRLLWS